MPRMPLKQTVYSPLWSLGSARLSYQARGRSAKLLGVAEVVVEVIEDSLGFAALEEEWEGLHRQCPRATPFQSWAWLYSWWELYGDNHELRLVTVRDGRGLLVGVAPLMLEYGRGLSRLLFVGTEQTDYLDVLIRERWEDQVSEVLARTLGGIDSWQVVDLQQLRPGAAAWDICRHWDGPQLRAWQDSFPVIDVRPWDELLQSLSGNLRSTVRRTLRRFEADGGRCELAGVDDAEAAAKRLVAISREQWQERWLETGPEHWTSRFESHIVAAARRMTARNLGGVSEFWRDGEVIISDFWVSGRDFVGTYMLGASREALQRYQWSSLYIWDALNIARSKNCGYLDLLRGDEPYKLRWSSRISPSHRLILGRNLAFWTPYAGYHALRSRARRYVQSESTPRWIGGAITESRILRRYGVGRYVRSGRMAELVKAAVEYATTAGRKQGSR
jgi:CelD/BcsL family acetyltransferase involved in cellulose biosynthesis